jgi:hypothetical protein
VWCIVRHGARSTYLMFCMEAMLLQLQQLPCSRLE